MADRKLALVALGLGLAMVALNASSARDLKLEESFAAIVKGKGGHA